MARPKKHKELKRNHQIMLRLTDTEYEIISSNAKMLLFRWPSTQGNSSPGRLQRSLMRLWQIFLS